jgi:hypothetical protein
MIMDTYRVRSVQNRGTHVSTSYRYLMQCPTSYLKGLPERTLSATRICVHSHLSVGDSAKQTIEI